MEFDPKIVQVIIGAGIFGLPIKAAVNYIKAKLRIKGFPVFLISVIVCAATTAIYLLASGWNWPEFVVYTLLVFMATHGWYVGTKKPKPA